MGKLIEPEDDIFKRGEVGDWAFTEGETHIFLVLPLGGATPAENMAGLPITGRCTHPGAGTKFATWDWDGNREAPTLSPSILDVRTGWHGFFREGKIVPA